MAKIKNNKKVRKQDLEKYYISEKSWLMEVGLGRFNFIPAKVMFLLRFVSAFLEISFKLFAS